MGSVVRNQVYTAIDEERDHQETYESSGLRPAVGQELAIVLEQAREAMDKWACEYSVEEQDSYALWQFRKIAAVCVRAMENHGWPPRLDEEEIKIGDTD